MGTCYASHTTRTENWTCCCRFITVRARLDQGTDEGSEKGVAYTRRYRNNESILYIKWRVSNCVSQPFIPQKVCEVALLDIGQILHMFTFRIRYSWPLFSGVLVQSRLCGFPDFFAFVPVWSAWLSGHLHVQFCHLSFINSLRVATSWQFIKHIFFILPITNIAASQQCVLSPPFFVCINTLALHDSVYTGTPCWHCKFGTCYFAI